VSTDAAYAAGLFEGEGAIQLMRFRNSYGTDYFAIRSVIAMCDREALEWMQERWGGRIYTQKEHENHKPCWRLILTQRATNAFLKEIQPYLKVKRIKDKVALALEFQAQKGPQGRRATGDYNDRQRAYYDRMKLLNMRGVVGMDARAKANA